MKDVGKNGGLLFIDRQKSFIKTHSFKSIVVFVFWRIKPRGDKSSDIDGCPNFPHHYFDHLHEKMKYTTNLNLAKAFLCNVLPWNFVISNCDDGTKKLKEFFEFLLKCHWRTNKLWDLGVVLDFSLFNSFKNTKDGFGVF